MQLRTLAGVAAAALLAAGPALADEGMWTFDRFPADRVQAAYGVRIDAAWLSRVQAAAVRLSVGCSASLVSKEGLVLTNDHCVLECAQALSTAQKDHVADGFLTATRIEERRCPGLSAEILLDITDVTAKVNTATAGKSGLAFVQARETARAAIEEAACASDARLRCQVVSLYRGGQYKLYKYRRYTDVRLVFAPEYAAAFFGGDPDNFNFPRYCLDMAFLRLYEGGKPVATPQHLTWLRRAPKADEPVFVAGNPGGTDRQMTIAQLETQRDVAIPIGQLQRSELRGRLIRFSEESAEQKRLATDPLEGLENSFKVFYGRQLALNDRAFMDRKRAEEAELKAKVAADPVLAAQIGDPWGEIAKAQGAYAQQFIRYRQLESGAGGASELYGWARALVRAAAERAKPNGERLPEFADVRLPLVEHDVTEAKPIDPGLEQLYLEFWLSKTREYLTVDDAASRLLLGRESPEGLSARLVSETKLADPAVRKALWDGGWAAVQASTDPLIQFALKADPAAREARSRWEAEVSGPIDRAAETLARARFAVFGETAYPDATFTLRLSFGKVTGWSWRGADVPWSTTFAGLYERATGADPFRLAPRWADAKARLSPDTVFNFVTTNDIIGGNSGSPVVNAQGQVLGAAFDGNIHSLGGDYGYDGAVNRTVVVSTAAATEALDKVYGRAVLLRELTGR